MAIDLDACLVFTKAYLVLNKAAGFEIISSSCVIIWEYNEMELVVQE
jgi:hypothetical protein